jgi:hypothetical protein
MTITTLVIIIALNFPYQITINFEDMDTCLAAMDNFYMKFYKQEHSDLTLPFVETSCKVIKPKGRPK